MKERMVTVHEVVADIDGDGPACDGTRVFRFSAKRDADAFATAHTCYGRPATVSTENVPRRLAQRWGIG